MAIADKINLLKIDISRCEKQYQRPPGSVLLLVVSKGRSIEQIKTAYDTGQRHFGENYVQEALPKQLACPNDITWHYLGKIQSNKTAKIATHFEWVHCVESEKTAVRLNEHRSIANGRLNICIAVNIDGSVGKSGLSFTKVHDLARFCTQLPHLHLRGLMVMPSLSENLAAKRAVFHAVWMLFSDLCQQGLVLDTLSMGTSHDFQAAIAEGATIVRIGRAIWA